MLKSRQDNVTWAFASWNHGDYEELLQKLEEHTGKVYVAARGFGYVQVNKKDLMKTIKSLPNDTPCSWARYGENGLVVDDEGTPSF